MAGLYRQKNLLVVAFTLIVLLTAADAAGFNRAGSHPTIVENIEDAEREEKREVISGSSSSASFIDKFLSLCTSALPIKGLEKLRGKEIFIPLVDIQISSGWTEDPSVQSQQVTDVDTPEKCKDFCLCQFGTQCKVFSYNQLDKVCTISTLDFYSSWTNTVQEIGITSYYLYKPDTWKMVYRRPKLVKTPKWSNQVTGPWMDNSFYTDEIKSGAELSTDGIKATVLKSNAVKFWQQLNITQVRVGVYRGRTEVKYITFSGVGADSQSWLEKSRLLSSSWANLNSQSVKVQGFYPFIDWWWRYGNTIQNRGVYMLERHNGCPGDLVYLVALQNREDAEIVCDWERIPAADTPKILYSPTTASAAGIDKLKPNYSLSSSCYTVEEADSLVFSVKM